MFVKVSLSLAVLFYFHSDFAHGTFSLKKQEAWYKVVGANENIMEGLVYLR